MQKSPKTSSKTTIIARFSAALALAMLMLCSNYPGMNVANAAASCASKADCQAKINNATNVINSGQQQLSALAGQASTYQQTINDLQSQISGLQGQISSNQAQQASLNQQIIAAQQQLDQEKQVLSEAVRTMYIDGQMSTIEMLATSNNLSDYIDKAAYRQQVQVSVQETVTKIAAMQADLNTKKQAVDSLLAQQQAQQSQLFYAHQQQNSLLSYNQSQQAAYNQQVQSSKSDLSSLKARLSALNSTAGSKVSYSGTCGGSYPASATNASGSHWGCNYGQDNGYDNWHMLNRECVSYTAWMVNQKYGISTDRWGSAYNWINVARSKGYAVDQNPRAGDIAIRQRNYSEPEDVGHAMYVESVRSSSDITVWEYNQHYDGKFQERRFNPHDYSAPVYYIHFR